MRVSFVASTHSLPRRDQAGTSIMVELGNGDRFFFDLGNGSIKNILHEHAELAEMFPDV